MPISNQIKGIISIVQSMFLAFGASQMVLTPGSYEGLVIAVIGAIIGAVKHWADGTPTTGTPLQTNANVGP